MDRSLHRRNARFRQCALGLKLQLPLHRLPESKVQRRAATAGQRRGAVPRTAAAAGDRGQGRIHRARRDPERGRRQLPRRAAGADRRQPRDDSIVIRMGGMVSAEGLRKQYPAPALQPIVGKISGSTRFSGAVVKDHQATVTVDSSLGGLGLAFPAPLAKRRSRCAAPAFHARQHAHRRQAAGARRRAHHARATPSRRATCARRRGRARGRDARGHRRERAGARAGQRRDGQRQPEDAQYRPVDQPGQGGRQPAEAVRPRAEANLPRPTWPSTWCRT
jgi:hypothetical protein